MEGNILSVSGLTVSFDGHTIFQDVSFEVVRDSTWAVIGPNGAGKTVLFKALLGLIPYQGEVKWHPEARIGYVPQKLFVGRDFPLTVMEFFKLKEKDESQINKVLGLVGFKAKAEHVHHDTRVLQAKIGNLSGGELQRVLIAWALLGNPNVLLLDEPTAGVDLAGEETFYNLFKKLKQDKDLTIIFISHDTEVVKRYSDCVLELMHEHNETHDHYQHHHHEH